MGKVPGFYFFIKDWLCDPQLQSASACSRGIWINALCYMWEAPERGKLAGTAEELAKLLRADNGDFLHFLDDVKRLKFGDVTFCNNDVTLINRRMIREQKIRENTRLRVAKHRRNIQCNGGVQTPFSEDLPIPKYPLNHKERIKKESLSLPEWIDQKLWSDFLSMRKEIKKPASLKAQFLLVQKLDTLRASGNDPTLVLEQSIMNCWQGLFELKNPKPQKKNWRESD